MANYSGSGTGAFSFGSQSLGPDGSAAAPTYSFANASNTGMSLSGASVVLASSGAARLTLSSTATWADGLVFAFGSTTGTKLGTATTQKLAFFNSTPIVQPTVTGSKGANAALTSLMTALGASGLGLVADSTS